MERIARYSAQKKRAVEMVQFIDSLPKNPQIEKLLCDIRHCASYLVFHDYYTIDETRLVAAHTCKKHLLCPFCAGRRAAKYVDKSIQIVKSVLSENKSFKPVMITLTVKNGDNLGERIGHIKKSFRRLQDRRRDFLKKGRGWTEFVKVSGAIYAYEVTNKGNGWHPHIHMFALLNDWIDQKALSSEWESITGDSKIVGIERIKPRIQVGSLSIESGMLEVIKYSMKFSDLSLSDNWYAFEVLRGQRLLGSFGSLRGIPLPDSLLDDMLQGLPYLELIYRFNLAQGSYDLKSSKSESGAA